MIEWDDAYSVHNAHIDVQHKKLFELTKQAYSMVNHRVSAEEIRAILVEFFGYIKEHFKDEEAYMQAIDYPRIQEHKKIHNEITQSMVVLIKEVKNANDMKEKLLIIAKKWLLEHILKEDMKIEKYRRSLLTGQNSDFTGTIEIAKEVYFYTCACPGKIHDVPLDIHRRIASQGEKFRCKVCKADIVFARVQKVDI